MFLSRAPRGCQGRRLSQGVGGKGKCGGVQTGTKQSQKEKKKPQSLNLQLAHFHSPVHVSESLKAGLQACSAGGAPAWAAPRSGCGSRRQ